MKVSINWNEKMHFTGHCEKHHIEMDAKLPIGSDSAMTPKELVVQGLAGCTAMDVIALMKKHKQALSSFKVDVDVTKSEGPHPQVFTQAVIHFYLSGQIDASIASESVKLSQTKFCGVSAMLSKAFPIYYHVYVNNEKVSQGQANFDL